MNSSFTILTVCTGNVCRSPLAQQLLAALLADEPGIEVASAGTHALIGAPMDRDSQQQAYVLGVEDSSGHRARQLNEQILESADLILALTREHRKEIVQLSPRVTRKTYTLIELARLEEVTNDEWLASELDSAAYTEDSMDRLRAGVKILGANRSLLTPLADPNDEDVIDPYRESVEVHETSADQIALAVESVVRLIRRMMA